ncbi:MAG: peptidase S9, partial [Bacteroidaceae bacterium]|nr:peptidase S9 [Bacteroidaceae bacterium]
MKTTRTFIAILASIAFMSHIVSCQTTADDEFIGRNEIALPSDTLTPEALWAMGRIGAYEASPNGEKIAYQVTYYSVALNKSHTVLYVCNADGSDQQLLTATSLSESSPTWLSDDRIAFLSEGEVWSMNAAGKERKQLTQTEGSVDDFLFAPDGEKVILIKSVP